MRTLLFPVRPVGDSEDGPAFGLLRWTESLNTRRSELIELINQRQLEAVQDRVNVTFHDAPDEEQAPRLAAFLDAAENALRESGRGYVVISEAMARRLSALPETEAIRGELLHVSTRSTWLQCYNKHTGDVFETRAFDHDDHPLTARIGNPAPLMPGSARPVASASITSSI